jgi:hypothetical protein
MSVSISTRSFVFSIHSLAYKYLLEVVNCNFFYRKPILVQSTKDCSMTLVLAKMTSAAQPMIRASFLPRSLGLLFAELPLHGFAKTRRTFRHPTASQDQPPL